MRKWLALLLRLCLGALFAWAGFLKLQDPAAFANDIANYRLLPSLAPWMAAALPMVELVLGAAVIAAPLAWRRAAALSLAAIMGVFTVAVSQALLRGISIDCGCFGSSASPVTALTVVRDVALFAAAAAILALDGPREARAA